jgi:hypothetical protein
MKLEPKEQQIVELLTKLKDQGGTYPKKMLASRRQVFLSQMASVGLGLGIGTGIKTIAKSSKGGGLFHLSSLSASSIVETILVIVIVAQGSIITYNYRDKIADYINTLSTSSVPTPVSIPVTVSPQPEVTVSNTPTTTATETPTASPSSTVTIVATDTTVSSGTGSGGNTVQNTAVTDTPQPTNDNPGNHYGQTPRPTQQKTDPKPTQGTGGGKNP